MHWTCTLSGALQLNRSDLFLLRTNHIHFTAEAMHIQSLGVFSKQQGPTDTASLQLPALYGAVSHKNHIHKLSVFKTDFAQLPMIMCVWNSHRQVYIFMVFF